MDLVERILLFTPERGIFCALFAIIIQMRKKVVVIGGGTGTYTVLTGLKKYDLDITAIVSVADSGGSSGRLRDEFGILPPGDVRQALVALSSDESELFLLRRLFSYRFDRGFGLNGHSFGNLFLTALSSVTGGIDKAIVEAGKILHIKGKVYPVTLDDIELCARLEDGTIIKGETNIDLRRVRPDLRIIDVFLNKEAKIGKSAKEAIIEADLIILGPGDLYTSVIPNLLVKGVNESIARSKGKLVYVLNIMTKRGETKGFSALDFISEIKKYSGSASSKLSSVVANSGTKFPERVLRRYKKEGSEPVFLSEENGAYFDFKVVRGDFVSAHEFLRHDSGKLAKAITLLVKP